MISQSQLLSPLTCSFLCSMKLITALERLQILHTHRDQGHEERRWRIPADGTRDEDVVLELNRVMPLVVPLVPKAKAAKGNPYDPRSHLDFVMVDGPDFTNPMTVPGDHENHVARLYRFLSLVLWAFLRHLKFDPRLPEPRKVACFAHTFIGRCRQHRLPAWTVIALSTIFSCSLPCCRSPQMFLLP